MTTAGGLSAARDGSNVEFTMVLPDDDDFYSPPEWGGNLQQCCPSCPEKCGGGDT